MSETRLVKTIAAEIREDWTNINPAANAYLEAMEVSNYIDSMYLFETVQGIVLYFLSNAGSWRGETARRIKKELKEMSS